MTKPLLVILLICLYGISQHSICAQTPSETGSQTKDSPTQEEIREARALIRRLSAQLKKTGDITGIIDELYVQDFNQHLRAGLNDVLPLRFDQAVLTMAKDEQIRRIYINVINSIYLAARVGLAADKHRRLTLKADPDEETELDFSPADLEAVLPPELFKLLSDDPVIGRAFTTSITRWKLERATSSEKDVDNEPSVLTASIEEDALTEQDQVSELIKIETIDRMEHYNELMEKADALVRKHLEKLPPELIPDEKTAMVRLTGIENANPKEAEINILQENEFLGYPPDTRFLSTSFLFFHVDVVRSDYGQLKIAAVHFNISD